MPLSLNGFVQNRQEQKYKEPLSASEKERRKNIAHSIKIKSTPSYKTPSQNTYLQDNTYPLNTSSARTNLANIQPSGVDAYESGDLFDNSTLSSDTEGTLRDITIGGQIQQNPRSGPFPEQEGIGSSQSLDDDDPNGSDGEDGYEEEKEPGYIGQLAHEYNPAYMGTIGGIRMPVGNLPSVKLIDGQEQERIKAFMQNDQYRQLQKKSSDPLISGQVANVFYGRSGRFMGLDIPQETKLVEEYNDYIEQDRNPSPDSPAYGDSDSPRTPIRREELGDGYDRISENAFGNREFAGHTPDGKHRNEITFKGAEHAGSSIQSSSTENTSQAHRSFIKQRLPVKELVNNKRTVDILDYDEATLSSMDYTQLRDQSFDTDPKLVPLSTPKELRGSEVSLEDRLVHFKGQTVDEKVNFFSQMPIDEWEASGEWFLARFSNIISKLGHARQARRDLSKDFEEELAAREERVRGKTEEISEEMQRMRAGGEGVLKRRKP